MIINCQTGQHQKQTTVSANFALWLIFPLETLHFVDSRVYARFSHSHMGRSSSSRRSGSGAASFHVTDYYKVVTAKNHVHDLLEEALKVNISVKCQVLSFFSQITFNYSNSAYTSTPMCDVIMTSLCV